MIQQFKTEWERMINGRMFWLSIFVGCIIALIQIVAEVFPCASHVLEFYSGKWGEPRSLYKFWMGMNYASPYKEIFLTILPILAMMPHALSYYMDCKSGYIKSVYTIVLIDKSTGDFHKYKDRYCHIFQQRSDTGLELNLLQKYVFLPLDIFRENMHNKGITDKLDAWLAFLSMDSPEVIVKLIKKYPEFTVMYEHIYNICRNVEGMMEMYSEELKILDRNTVKYMVDQMQEQIDNQKEKIAAQEKEIQMLKRKLEEQK